MATADIIANLTSISRDAVSLIGWSIAVTACGFITRRFINTFDGIQNTVKDHVQVAVEINEKVIEIALNTSNNNESIKALQHQLGRIADEMRTAAKIQDERHSHLAERVARLEAVNNSNFFHGRG